MKFHDNFASIRRQEMRERSFKPHGLESNNRHGKHYCEGCKLVRPSNKQPVVKGWRCTECAVAGK